MPEPRTKNMEAVHAILNAAYEAIGQLKSGNHERLLDGLGSDTLVAIGYAMGSIGKAKAMVGRDIDDARRDA
jgi:hypothetical protein